MTRSKVSNQRKVVGSYQCSATSVKNQLLQFQSSIEVHVIQVKKRKHSWMTFAMR